MPTCRAALAASLTAAVQAAMDTQGVESVDELTYDKALDSIVSVPAGVVGSREIDWRLPATGAAALLPSPVG